MRNPKPACPVGLGDASVQKFRRESARVRIPKLAKLPIIRRLDGRGDWTTSLRLSSNGFRSCKDAPKIPALDLTPEIDLLWNDIQAAIADVMRSGQFILGPQVRSFEDEMARILAVKHAVACNSGTDALVIGLRALGIGPGDEVITTPFTFFATAEAISLIGAEPVFVDIDPRTLNIDPRLIAEALTPRTKAILPVHLFGHAADMDPILEIARQYNLVVLEDVAQAFGGRFHGRPLGTLGHAGAFSFYPTKNLRASATPVC